MVWLPILIVYFCLFSVRPMVHSHGAHPNTAFQHFNFNEYLSILCLLQWVTKMLVTYNYQVFVCQCGHFVLYPVWLLPHPRNIFYLQFMYPLTTFQPVLWSQLLGTNPSDNEKPCPSLSTSSLSATPSQASLQVNDHHQHCSFQPCQNNCYAGRIRLT